MVGMFEQPDSLALTRTFQQLRPLGAGFAVIMDAANYAATFYRADQRHCRSLQERLTEFSLSFASLTSG